ncbi:MAG: single-stranded DNA-binding protein [bacterium]
MVNKVVLVGRITKDVELKTTQSGINNCKFTIAVNRQFKNSNGVREADFISCVAWKNQAEFLNNYVRKGNQISVVGKIQTSSYTDDNNNVRYTTDVVVESVSNLEPRADNQNSNYQNGNTNNNAQSNNVGNQPQSYDIDDDDLPF